MAAFENLMPYFRTWLETPQGREAVITYKDKDEKGGYVALSGNSFLFVEIPNVYRYWEEYLREIKEGNFLHKTITKLSGMQKSMEEVLLKTCIHDGRDPAFCFHSRKKKQECTMG